MQTQKTQNYHLTFQQLYVDEVAINKMRGKTANAVQRLLTPEKKKLLSLPDELALDSNVFINTKGLGFVSPSGLGAVKAHRQGSAVRGVTLKVDRNGGILQKTLFALDFETPKEFAAELKKELQLLFDSLAK